MMPGKISLLTCCGPVGGFTLKTPQPVSLITDCGPLKPFTDSSLGWNSLPPSARGARCRLARRRFYGSHPALIGWWIQKVKGGKVTPLALAVTASQPLLSMSRQTTLDKNGTPQPPRPHRPSPSLRLLALRFTADRRDICSQWNL